MVWKKGPVLKDNIKAWNNYNFYSSETRPKKKDETMIKKSWHLRIHGTSNRDQRFTQKVNFR